MAQNPQSPNPPLGLPARRPRLRPVQVDGRTFSQYPTFVQFVDETCTFNGRVYYPDDEWISAVLFPNDLGIGFAERIADIPSFISEIEVILGFRVERITGVAAQALQGDQPLLGDWIRAGTFDKDRLMRKFEQVLGSKWQVKYNIRNARALIIAYQVEISRVPGT